MKIKHVFIVFLVVSLLCSMTCVSAYDNDKNKVMKFFQKRGSLSNLNEKPKIEFHKKNKILKQEKIQKKYLQNLVLFV